MTVLRLLICNPNVIVLVAVVNVISRVSVINLIVYIGSRNIIHILTPLRHLSTVFHYSWSTCRRQSMLNTMVHCPAFFVTVPNCVVLDWIHSLYSDTFSRIVRNQLPLVISHCLWYLFSFRSVQLFLSEMLWGHSDGMNLGLENSLNLFFGRILKLTVSPAFKFYHDLACWLFDYIFLFFRCVVLEGIPFWMRVKLRFSVLALSRMGYILI